MYGLRIIIGREYRRNIPMPIELRHLSRSDVTNQTFFDNGEVKILAQKYEEYPLTIIELSDTIIAFEGMVYNIHEDDFINKIKSIIGGKTNYSIVNSEIRKLINNTDGDFLVFVYLKVQKSFIIFGDYWARIPLFYYKKNGLFIVSRSQKFIYDYMDSIDINRFALVDYLKFGYPLGNKLLVEGIFRMKPTEIIQGKISAKGTPEKITHNEDNGFNFDRSNRPFSVKRSISDVYNLLQAGTDNRRNTVLEKGYNLQCDISGGFDTRTVFGLLRNHFKEIGYNTHINFNNELKVIYALLEKFKINKDLLKIAEPTIAIDIASDKTPTFVYDTDALVDYYTTIGALDFRYLESKHTKGAAVFMGFGGEFIRHPYYIYYQSLSKTIKLGCYGHKIDVDDVCKIVNVDPKDYQNYLERYIGDYQEKTKEGRLKRFYFEYYLNVVIHAGEDRCRFHNWTIQPLMSKNFLDYFFYKLPLSWTGFYFHSKLLKMMSSDLTKVSMHNSNLNLQSNLNLIVKELKIRFGGYYSIFKRVVWKNTNKKEQQNPPIEPLFDNLFIHKIINCSRIVNPELAKNHIEQLGGKYNYLITFLLYLEELKKDHPEIIRF